MCFLLSEWYIWHYDHFKIMSCLFSFLVSRLMQFSTQKKENIVCHLSIRIIRSTDFPLADTAFVLCCVVSCYGFIRFIDIY